MEHKFTIVLNEKLESGQAVNVTGILSMGMTKHVDLLGEDVVDGDGVIHSGITKYSVIILKTSKDNLKNLFDKAQKQDVKITDFTNIAQQIHDDYDSYAKSLSQTKNENIELLGIGLFGTKKVIKSLTGQFGLFR